jgi:oligopeptidase B
MPGRWVIRTDWEAKNFRLMSVPDAEIGDRARWTVVFPYDERVFIDNFELFTNYIAIGERSDGLLRIRIVPWAAPEKSAFIPADESAYAETFGTNAEQDTETLRYAYTSLVTPSSVYDVNMRTGERTLRKQAAVIGYDPSKYATERIWITARDGVKVPISIAYKKGYVKDGTAPMYQYAYGSYGSSSDPEFDQTVISLLDRGFVYALAHIRGGQEMGRAWYDDGKLLKKKNTFTDFVDATDALVREKYAAPDKVFAMGLSAGDS